jgi:hypothetical protein
MDPKDLGILGGAGSALIAALSYWAKTRHERRRATRTVLYYLLELHHVVHRMRAALEILESALVGELKAAFQARGFAFDESAAAAALKQAGPLIAGYGRIQLEGTVADSEDAFSKALVDLAKEDPVLAFRLRGRDQMTVVRQKLQAFASEHSAALSPEASETNWSHFDEFLSTMALEELRTAIRATSWECDLLTHLKTNILLRKSASKQLSGELREVVTAIAHSYVSAVASQRRAPA